MRALTAALSLFLILFCNPVSAEAEKGVDIKQVQTVLAKLCYEPGVVDGLWGRKTEAAVKAFFSRYNRMYRGKFDKNDENFVLTVGDGATPRGLVACTPVNKESGNEKVQYFEYSGDNKDASVTFFPNQIKIPDNLPYQPNDATIAFYIKYQEAWAESMPRHKVKPARDPLKIKHSLEEHELILKQLSSSTILSYLYYADGVIVYDAVVPEKRFGMSINDRTYFPSQSMGKSITSYLVGHAICQGYISSVDAPIQDWPLMENTLYYGQPLINLLNMKSGDTSIIKEFSDKFTVSGRSIHDSPLVLAVQTPSELKNSKPSASRSYSYSNLSSNVVFNYLMHRTAPNFDNFIADFYKKKIKNQYPIYHMMNPLANGRTKASTLERTREAAGRFDVWATRYDYLRIALAMMHDWQSDSCEGKYLKEIYDRRVRINRKQASWQSQSVLWGKPQFNNTASKYGGQFWTNFSGLNDRKVLLMDGYNGQQIIMDMDNSRIVAIAAAKSKHYSTYKLGFEPIKYGRIR